MADDIVMRYGETKPWKDNPAHTVHYLLGKVMQANGDSYFSIFELTVNEKGDIYHRGNRKVEEKDVLNELKRGEYGESIYQMEYPELGATDSRPSMQPQYFKVVIDNDTNVINLQENVVDQLLANQQSDITVQNGVATVRPESLPLFGGDIEKRNEFCIYLRDHLNNRVIAFLLPKS